MNLKIFKNSIFVLTTQILLLLTNFVIYILIGRQLGPDGLGDFAFVLAFAGMFVFLPDLGLGLYLTREISRGRDEVREYLGYAFSIVFMLSPLVYVLVILIANFINISQEVLYSIYFVGIYLIFGSFLGLFRASFHAYENMELETYSITVERIFTVILSFIVLLIGRGLIWLIIAHIIARGFALIMSGVLYKLKISTLPRFSFNAHRMKKMVTGSFPFALNTLTTTVYIQADLVLLTLWIGSQASGYYKAASSLIIPLAVVATALNSATFPGMARAHQMDKSALKPTIEFSIRYLFMIGWPLAIGIFILAPQIISILYGSEFYTSILLLQILAIIVPMRFINNTMGFSLTAIDKQGLRATIILISAIINLVLNVLLIPRWSSIGTSITTVVTEVIISICLFVAINIYLEQLKIFHLLDRTFLSGLILAVGMIILRNSNVIIIVIASAIIYVLSLFILKAIPENDIHKFFAAVRELASRRAEVINEET